MSPTAAHVFLLWLNDAVIGVFESLERARDEAGELMANYGGTWHEVTEQRWGNGVAYLMIEPRKVH